MNETISNKTPRQKNAAIFPATGMLLISNIKSFSNVIRNSISEIIRSGLNLYFIPSHIKLNEHNPHRTGRHVLMNTF